MNAQPIREALSPQERYRSMRGYRHTVDRLFEVLEDRVEDLEIAGNPEVCAAINRLIAEVTGHRYLP